VMATYGPQVKRLLKRIGDAGYSGGFLRRFLPDWWTPEVEAEPGAIAELKIRLARRLGLDLSQLLEGDAVAFAMPRSVKYKRSVRVTDSGVNEPFLAYCTALARTVAATMPRPSKLPLSNAEDERSAILSDERINWLSLNALLRRCWTELNIAVLQVVDAPTDAKSFDAVSFNLNGRFVILLAKKSSHPSWAAFMLAHELGHIANGHVPEGEALLDELPDGGGSSSDTVDHEERIADKYALSLLGGHNLTSVQVEGQPNQRSLAEGALEAGRAYRVDPGHLILRYARESNNWEIAQAALNLLAADIDVASSVNTIAKAFLDFSDVSDDSRANTLEALGIAI
jgi:hypothetical protein